MSLRDSLKEIGTKIKDKLQIKTPKTKEKQNNEFYNNLEYKAQKQILII
jgi:hypothetical protein